MKSYIETRAVEIANYIVENNATVRQAAKQFGISKSTVHKDITDADRLLRIDPELAAKARHILDINKSERHIRGGLAHQREVSASASCACRLSAWMLLSLHCQVRSFSRI